MQLLGMLFAAMFLTIPIAALLLALNALSRVKGLEQELKRLATGAQPPAPRRAPEVQPPTSAPPPAPVDTPVPVHHEAPPVIAPPLPPTRTLEERIGARWATWAGIVTIVFAVGFFIRLVFQHNLIGVTGRVAIGLAIGLAMLVTGLAIRKRGALPFLSVGLSGGGLAILYLSLYAGYDRYHLFTSVVAFAAMFVVTLAGSAIAAVSDELALAVLAVLGGLLTPILARSTRADELKLMGYLVVLDLLVLGVSRWRSWPALIRLAWTGTALLLVPVFVWTPHGHDPSARLALLTVLFAIFLAIPLVRAWLDRVAAGPLDLLLVIANGALYFSAVYITLETWHPAFEGPWAFALAAAYLAAGAFHRERVPEDEVTATVHYGAAAVMIALAFPLMLDGPWVTLAWAVQAVVLVLVAQAPSQRDTALVGAFLLFAAAFARAGYLDRHWYPSDTRFLNVSFVVGLAVVAAQAIGGWLVARVPDRGPAFRSTFWVGASLLLAALLWHEPTGVWPGVLLSLEVVGLSLLARHQGDDAFRVAAIAVATIAIARLYLWDARKAMGAAEALFNPWLFARVGAAIACAYAGDTLRRATGSVATRSSGKGLLGLAWLQLVVALSLGWFLHMDDRIRAVAGGPEGVDAQSALRWQLQLGLSALWAVYAGISLVLGFVWSHAMLRYASLALLGVTIAKVFLFDLSAVQAVWRVLSFLVLGLVLLAVSVLYQRRMK